MPKLRKFTVEKNQDRDRWELKDPSGHVRRTAPTKAELTAGGELSDALGREGGSVRIRKENGEYQEERTYPRSRDPRSSKG